MSLVNSQAHGWTQDRDAPPYLMCDKSQNEWIPLFAIKEYVTIGTGAYYYLKIPTSRVEEIKTRQIVNTVCIQSSVRKVKFPKSDFDFYFQKGLFHH